MCDYVQSVGGSVWTEVLVDALGLVGVREKAARQAIARLGDEKMIVASRIGRRVQWGVTDKGLRWLAEARDRSERFSPAKKSAVGNWLILTVAFGEEQRDIRYHLNQRLASLGWGSIGPSMWLNSGAVSEEAVTRTLRRLGVEATSMLLRADFRPPTQLEDLVERAWNIPALATRYRQFIYQFDGLEPRDDSQAFAACEFMNAQWAHWFWTDPRLPAELFSLGPCTPACARRRD